MNLKLLNKYTFVHFKKKKEEILMILLERKKLDLYRYIVAKIVFLKAYRESYTLIEDIRKSNCMIVETVEHNRIIVSLFRKPTKKCNANYPLFVFYEDNAKVNSHENKHFSQSFLESYKNSIVQAFFKPALFIQENQNSRIFLEEIEESAYIAMDTSGSVFKYYSKNIELNKYHTLDGHIAFRHPKYFNDPFDCECLFANGSSVRDNFRVFCSIPDNRNILMWSYYGEDHSGYCFEYSRHSIITELIKLGINALCIIGDVIYSKKRPNYKLKTNSLSFSNIIDLINCTFTKYNEWEHEKEYRFVLIYDAFNDGGNTEIEIPIINILRGCKNTGTPLINSSGTTLNTTTLVEDPNYYRLN